MAKCLNARFPSRGSPGLGPFLSFSGSSWIMGSAGQLWPVAQRKTARFLNCKDGSSQLKHPSIIYIELSYPHEKIEKCRTFLKHDLPRFLAAQFLSKINGAKQKIAAGCFTFVAHHSNFLATKRIVYVIVVPITVCSTPQANGAGCATILLLPLVTRTYAYRVPAKILMLRGTKVTIIIC